VNHNYGGGKRQRETEQARKRQDKEQQRMARRERGPGRVEIVSASDIQGGMPSIEEAMRNIENRGQVSRAAASIPARLFVGGLADETTEHQLREAFGQFGPVADVVVMVDRDTRAPRGFGFVTMENRRDAPRVIEGLDGSQFNGRRLVVNVATDRPR
jgi:RNA recognition motif-containing protein